MRDRSIDTVDIYHGCDILHGLIEDLLTRVASLEARIHVGDRVRVKRWTGRSGIVQSIGYDVSPSNCVVLLDGEEIFQLMTLDELEKVVEGS